MGVQLILPMGFKASVDAPSPARKIYFVWDLYDHTLKVENHKT